MESVSNLQKKAFHIINPILQLYITSNIQKLNITCTIFHTRNLFYMQERIHLRTSVDLKHCLIGPHVYLARSFPASHAGSVDTAVQ